MALWNIALVFIPYGTLLHFSKPISVFIVVTFLKLLSIGIWCYAVFKSIFIKTLIPASGWIVTSTLNIGYDSEQISCFNRDIGPAVRVFANGPGDLGSIPGRVIPKTLKMVLDTTLLNTQHYKVRFKGKVEQSWEWSSALPYTLV